MIDSSPLQSALFALAHLEDLITVAGYDGKSEENLEFVASSVTVAGLDGISEENLEIVTSSITVAGYDGMSEENLEIHN